MAPKKAAKGAKAAPKSKKPAPAAAKKKPAPVAKVVAAAQKLTKKAVKVVASAVKAAKPAAAPAAAPAYTGRSKKPPSAANSAKLAAASLAKVRPGGAPSSDHSRAAEAHEVVCREVACEGLATSGGYCRLHYIKNWKKIKRKELILKEKKLNQYIEELVAKYPDKYIEAIKQDLASEKDFAKVIYDLDLDENVDDFDADAENVEAVIDMVKRDFEDEGDGF